MIPGINNIKRQLFQIGLKIYRGKLDVEIMVYN